MNRTNLLEQIPEEPEWVDARGILCSGRCNVFQTPDDSGCVIRSTQYPFAAVWGEPDVDTVRRSVAGVVPPFSILAQTALPSVREALEGWREEGVWLHRYDSPVEPMPEVPAGISLFVGSGRDLTASERRLSPGSQAEMTIVREHDIATAAAIEDDDIVAVCFTTFVTDRYWDVSIDTIETHRRRGLATLCFEALRRHLEPRGLTPVWGAHDSNTVSQRMAAALGFERHAHPIVWWSPGSR